MANWANTHKMTGVGNALKRHYQALLLEYELANTQDVTHQASTLLSLVLSAVHQSLCHVLVCLCVDTHNRRTMLQPAFQQSGCKQLISPTMQELSG